MKRVSDAAVRSALACGLVGCSFVNGTLPTSDGRVVDTSVDTISIDTPVDTPIDGSFDPANCPIDYTYTVPSVPTSKYRLLLASAKYFVQYTDCVNDSSGLTHLVIYNNQTEAMQVGAMYGAVAGFGPNSVFYIGGVQAPNQPGPATSWLWLTGGPILTMWSNGAPNDGDNIENNRENVARSVTSGLIEDALASLLVNGVCECDGYGVEPTIATYVPP